MMKMIYIKVKNEIKNEQKWLPLSIVADKKRMKTPLFVSIVKTLLYALN